MGFYKSVLRPILFVLNPEAVHNLALWLISRGFLRARQVDDPILRTNVFGLEFRNPVGLAAGFDKSAVALEHWGEMGFGFAEVGTVTPEPQPGNPRPRLFRLSRDEALVNRMGFNNDGARAVATRLAEARPAIPIGVNIGKNKSTAIERAPEDYAGCARTLKGRAAYTVVNVSSPNTEGLLGLQDPAKLKAVLEAVREQDSETPLLVKVSPDLQDFELEAVASLAQEVGIQGIVAVNTTLSRAGLQRDIKEQGGLSGRPITKRANEVMARLHRCCGRSMVLIGVGGIFDGRDLFDRIAAGANLCQMYTGWVYEGPQGVPRALEELAGLMRLNGIESVEALRGTRSGVK